MVATATASSSQLALAAVIHKHGVADRRIPVHLLAEASVPARTCKHGIGFTSFMRNMVAMLINRECSAGCCIRMRHVRRSASPHVPNAVVNQYSCTSLNYYTEVYAGGEGCAGGRAGVDIAATVTSQSRIAQAI